MYRYQGHSMPGFGVGVVVAVLTLVIGPSVSTDVRAWHAGVIGLGVWVIVDVLSIVSLRRKAAAAKDPADDG